MFLGHASFIFSQQCATRCIVKGEAQKCPLFQTSDILGVFDFLRIACSLGIPQTPLVNPLVFTMPLVSTLLIKESEKRVSSDFQTLFGPFGDSEAYSFGDFGGLQCGGPEAGRLFFIEGEGAPEQGP